MDPLGAFNLLAPPNFFVLDVCHLLCLTECSISRVTGFSIYGFVRPASVDKFCLAWKQIHCTEQCINAEL